MRFKSHLQFPRPEDLCAGAQLCGFPSEAELLSPPRRQPGALPPATRSPSKDPGVWCPDLCYLKSGKLSSS